MTTDPNADRPLHLAVIGGSGLEQRLGDLFSDPPSTAPDEALQTPFGPTSGPILTGSIGGVRTSLLARHGPGHVLNPSAVPYRANIFALKRLGVTHLVASGATGSLRESIEPGQLVLVDQFIDRTRDRARTFYEHAAVHVEFADPCCPVLRRWLRDAAGATEVLVHERGTYVCMEGPAFSTRAESRLHRQMGGDLIGMTALPEARLAREAEIAYALVALPTDYDCWRGEAPTLDAPASSSSDGDGPDVSLLQEIMGNLDRATTAFIALLRSALTDVTPLRSNPSPAHDALALGIWSDKSAIDPAEIERLHPLWGRHFGRR